MYPPGQYGGLIMALTPLQNIVQLKPRPETTLALEASIQAGVHTVQGYRFTPSLRDYFREILELVVSERGRGYWIQAEYGAGKTHLLGTLGVLLTDSTGDAWDAVTDPEIRSFKTAFVGKTRLFPVVLNCKGRLATQGSAPSLQQVIERAIDDALGRVGLRGKVTVGTADEILEWWERASPGVRADITQQVKSRFAGHPTPEDLLNTKGAEAFAMAIIDAAQAVHIEIPYTRDIRTRFQHIYRQLTTQHGYHGMVVIIDEFKSWQELHAAGSQGYVKDEHVLETLAFHLPVDDHARIITIVGSQSGPAAKMLGSSQGDRFQTFSLFASDQSAREYDEIVAFRVRELQPERMPEVDQYYRYYCEHFTFLAHTKREYFRDIFPFQPRCFEVIRNITKHELATARSSIHYVHEILSDGDVLGRTALIKVADLLQSENLVRDLNTTVYKEAYTSYQAAYEALPELFDEEGDQRLAGDVLKTLFLWYCAFPEAHRGLTAHELAEACLAEDETIKQEDLIHGIILQHLREL